MNGVWLQKQHQRPIQSHMTITRRTSYLVRPRNWAGITPFCTTLTGITVEQVKAKGRPWPEVARTIINVFGPGAKVVVGWGRDDVDIAVACEAYGIDNPLMGGGGGYLNIASVIRILLGADRSGKMGLAEAMVALGLEWPGRQHDALVDAEATAMVWIAMAKAMRGVSTDNRQQSFDALVQSMPPVDRPTTSPEPDPVIEQGLADQSPSATRAWLRRWVHRRLELGVPVDRVAGQLGMTEAEVTDLANKDDLSPGVCAISGNPGACVCIEPDGTLEAFYGSVHDGIRFVWLTPAPPGLNTGDCLCDQVIDEMVAAGRLAPYRSTFAGQQIAATDATIAAGLAAEQSWPTKQIFRLLNTSRPPDIPALALLASLIQTSDMRGCSVEDLLAAWREPSKTKDGGTE